MNEHLIPVVSKARLGALGAFGAFALGVAACAAPTDDPARPARTAEARCQDPGVVCQAYGRQNWQNRAPAYEIGDGVSAPTVTVVYDGPTGRQPVDLEWNPRKPSELWVVNYGTSDVTILTNPGEPGSTVTEVQDPAYSHFMYRPPAIAFGSVSTSWGQQFATCGDNDNGGNYFMGPTLYSASLQLFGTQTPEGRGSHLDMLHSTPYCRGIAWEGTGNQYWVFNAYQGSIDYYDFRSDHGPGNDDHSDGVIRRYWKGQVAGVTGVMSHVSKNREDGKLYVADTGHKRILRLDPTGATPLAPFSGYEPIVERGYYASPLEVLVPPGTLAAPSGIEVSYGVAFVTDAATSIIYAFKTSDGSLIRQLDTGLPAGSLSGLNFGPDGKIYFVDRRDNRVLRIDP